MAKPESVISLDVIDRKKKQSWIGRLLVTRWFKGRSVVKTEPYGHYMFCGSQGSGKSSSVLWYAERLRRRYHKRKIKYLSHDLCTDDHENCHYVKFDEPPKVKLYSNYGVGRHLDKKSIYSTVDSFDPYANEVRIVILDEIHSYFPKDGMVDKETKQIQSDLIGLFSQLRKRNTYILSTAQVYGRLSKPLREQCLYMVSCKVNLSGRLVNDFIPGDSVLCDDLGRWAGTPKHVYVHGLSEINYDSKRLIRQ